MTLFQALAFGIVQGLTEFLPISSSGHLILLPWFFGWEDPGLGFNVALHWGTLMGVVYYFRKDIGQLTKNTLKSIKEPKTPENQLPWKIALATVPAALAGFLVEDWAESVFRSPWVVALSLAVVAILLFWADRKKGSITRIEDLSWKMAILIGVGQSLALIPGVSRSGITMTVALFLGMQRETSVQFSFLLSLPIILGAGLLKGAYILHHFHDPIFWVGIVSSALSGYAAIALLLRFVRTRNFTPFVLYRLALAGLITFLLLQK